MDSANRRYQLTPQGKSRLPIPFSDGSRIETEVTHVCVAWARLLRGLSVHRLEKHDKDDDDRVSHYEIRNDIVTHDSDVESAYKS